MELIKHMLGICGEPHGLIYYVLSASGLSTFILYTKLKKEV